MSRNIIYSLTVRWKNRKTNVAVARATGSGATVTFFYDALTVNTDWDSAVVTSCVLVLGDDCASVTSDADVNSMVGDIFLFFFLCNFFSLLLTLVSFPCNSLSPSLYYK